MKPSRQSKGSAFKRYRHPPLRAFSPPIWLFFLTAAGALGLGSLAVLWPPMLLVALVICISLALIMWTSRLGDPLVVVLALVIFWLPFHTTISRFNISPQEVLVYGIWVFAAMLSPLGIGRWLLKVITSLPMLAQLAFLLFTLACLQSALRISHPNLITAFNNLRTVLFYPLLLALLVAYVVCSRRCGRLLIHVFVAGGILFALYALALPLWGVNIADGSVAGRLGAEASFISGYNPNNLGMYMALALSFTPGLLYEAWHASQMWFIKFMAVLTGMGIMGLALWFTYSRGALVALLLGLTIILLARVWMSGTRQRLITLGLVGLGIVAFGIFIAWKGVDTLGRYAGLLNIGTLSNDPNVQFRENLYARAFETVSEHFFTGTGFGSFALGAAVPFSPHNTYLDLWISTGLFGMLAFIASLLLGGYAALSVARHFHAQRRIADVLLMLGLASALTAFMAQGLVQTFEQQPVIAAPVWVLVSLAQATLLALQAKGKAQPEEGRWPQDDPPKADQAISEQPTLILPVQRVFEGWDNDLLANSGNPWLVEPSPQPQEDEQSSAADQTALPAALDTGEQSPQTTPISQGEIQQARAETLIQQAPASYLWNQIYALWFFAANFLLSIILTHGLSKQEYGVYAVLSTILSTLFLIFAFGLEDTATVFVPRILASDGTGGAGRIIARLITIRIFIVGGIGLILSVGFSAALPLLNRVGLSPSLLSNSSNHPAGISVALMVVYLVGTGLVTLENALFSALLKSRVTLIIGGGGQALNLLATAALLYAGYGTDGVFAALGIAAWLTGGAYLFALSPLLRYRSKQKIKDARAMRKLAGNAWLVNIINSALGKQMDIILMTAFSISYVSIGYYNLAYQLSDVVGRLLISGLGGVSLAAMSAALSAGGRKRLASMWRASLMLQMLFAVPLQVFGLICADQLVTLLYGTPYAGAIPLFRVFLAFGIFGRLIGGGVQQSGLYVVGHQRAVLIIRCAGFILNAVLDIALIPRYGPAGPLIATGFSQNLVGLIEYLLLRKQIPTSYPGAFARRVVGATIIPAIILLWWKPVNLIELVGSSILFTVLLIAGLLAFRTEEAGDFETLFKANPRLENLLAAISSRLPCWLAGTRSPASNVADSA